MDISLHLFDIIENSISAHATQIAVELESTKNSIFSFKIIDNGTGIIPSSLINVTTQGFTTKTNSSGLGLSLLKEATKANGGNLSIESNELGTLVLATFFTGEDKVTPLGDIKQTLRLIIVTNPDIVFTITTKSEITTLSFPTYTYRDFLGETSINSPKSLRFIDNELDKLLKIIC